MEVPGAGRWRFLARQWPWPCVLGAARAGRAARVLWASARPPRRPRPCHSGKPAFRRRRGGAKGAGRRPDAAGGREAAELGLAFPGGAAGECDPASPGLAGAPCLPGEEMAWPALHLPAPRPPRVLRWAPSSQSPALCPLHSRSLFVGGGAVPVAAALRQPTDPIKYYLCFKIPVIGYAAAFSEPRAKRSKISVRLGLFSSCKFPFL